MADTQTSRIVVQIGKTAVTYVLAATTAPVVYDGFGTLTLRPDLDVDDRGRTVRLVLIRAEHLQWQTMRYSSGLEGWTTSAGRFDYFDPEFIELEALLWKRLLGDAA